jgi:hypothetical protein
LETLNEEDNSLAGNNDEKMLDTHSNGTC